MTHVVKATAYHALDLAYRLRPADVAEIKASSGFTPEDALAMSMFSSRRAWAVIHKGRCEAIFGVAPWPMTPDVGAPWLLASSVFETIGHRVGKDTRKYVRECEALFPILANYVDARHTRSLRWLRWAGFELDSIDLHHGVESRPFFRFSKVSHHV
jgi:hypothetical protein